MKNQNHLFTIVLLALGFCVLSPMPKAFGVVPAPDGGYPGGNTAEGQSALLSLTSGLYNTGVGIYSLLSVTDGDFCTGVGAGTLLSNTGSSNTATGAGALLSNTTATDNTADGAFALFSNTAAGNTAIGSRALLNNTTGGTLENIAGLDVGPNVAVGWKALESNTVASANTAVGYQALHSFTTGPVGFEHLGLCTAVGFQALANATGGDGWENNAFGYQALMNNTDGFFNTAVGIQALFNNTTGGSNTALGNSALFANDTGNSNTAIGGGALSANISGSNNTALGVGAGDGITTANNVICIGTTGQNIDNSCWISNIFGQTTAGGIQVFIDSTNRLGTVTSSKRFKEEIKPMNNTSEALFALKPVTFRYKKEFDPTRAAQFGLVAEEVEKVNPDLVVHDKEGRPYSVRYDQVNAMLLNEFLKEHERVEEQQATITNLKSTASKQDATIAKQEKTITDLTKGMEALTAQLKQQAAQIQKVSARIQMSRPASRVASYRD